MYDPFLYLNYLLPFLSADPLHWVGNFFLQPKKFLHCKNNGGIYYLRSDFINGLVIAIVDTVAALDALNVIDGELLLLFHDGAVGALGFAGAALDAAIGDHICHTLASLT